MGRTLVIGDIHGAYRALRQVLDRSGFNPKKDRLITLGDYCDGWSETPEVVEELLLIESLSSDDNKPIFIKGNHDEWCYSWLKTGVMEPYRYNQGGACTVKAYQRTGIQGKHIMFFGTLHHYYIDENNRVFVHGGFTSRKGIGHESTQSNYYWDRDLWQLALLSHGRQHLGVTEHGRRFEKHHEIYIGHTATTMFRIKPHLPEYKDPLQANNGDITVPMNRCNIWNVDTGAGWYGKLTIMDLDSKEFWQSDMVNELYPDETERRRTR